VNPRDSHLGARPRRLAGHMVSRAVVLLPLAVGTLVLGMAIYHWVERLGWPDAFLNAAMLLGGMGPVDPLRTTAGKWLAGCYALLAGVVFLVLAVSDGGIRRRRSHFAHLRRTMTEPREQRLSVPCAEVAEFDVPHTGTSPVLFVHSRQL